MERRKEDTHEKHVEEVLAPAATVGLGMVTAAVVGFVAPTSRKPAASLLDIEIPLPYESEVVPVASSSLDINSMEKPFNGTVENIFTVKSTEIQEYAPEEWNDYIWLGEKPSEKDQSKTISIVGEKEAANDKRKVNYSSIISAARDRGLLKSDNFCLTKDCLSKNGFKEETDGSYLKVWARGSVKKDVKGKQKVTDVTTGKSRYARMQIEVKRPRITIDYDTQIINICTKVRDPTTVSETEKSATLTAEYVPIEIHRYRVADKLPEKEHKHEGFITEVTKKEVSEEMTAVAEERSRTQTGQLAYTPMMGMSVGVAPVALVATPVMAGAVMGSTVTTGPVIGSVGSTAVTTGPVVTTGRTGSMETGTSDQRRKEIKTQKETHMRASGNFATFNKAVVDNE